MMTPDRCDILYKAFHKAKALGLHSSIYPPPESFASELIGLLARKTELDNKYQSKRMKYSFHGHFHITFTMPFKIGNTPPEKMASPLDYNTQYPHYWSSDPRDILLGAQHNSLSSRFSGISIGHPIYDDKAMISALRHAIYTAILNAEATATFMLLPASGDLITNPYSKLLTAYPHLCCKLGIIPKGKLTYDNPQSWPSQDVALPQHTWDLQIIAVWITAARVYLNNQSPTWLQGLAKYIPEARWFVKSVRNDPIHNAKHAVMPGIGNLNLKSFP
eukprot:1145869-Pelagomonas_calceolata.AAC.1